MSPTADKPGRQVLELRQLDLELPFAGPGPACKDVENQLRPVNDSPAYGFFDVVPAAPGGETPGPSVCSLASANEQTERRGARRPVTTGPEKRFPRGNGHAPGIDTG